MTDQQKMNAGRRFFQGFEQCIGRRFIHGFSRFNQNHPPTSVQQRWPILQSGQVDVLSRNSTITFSRNATLGLNFQGINFYEGQTFIVRKKANAKTAADLDGASICVAAGSTEDAFARNRNGHTAIVSGAMR